MRYKRMGRNGTYRLQVPTLSGGVNAAVAPTMIEDNELCSAVNLRWKNGALTKRLALRPTEKRVFCDLPIETDANLTANADSILTHPIDIDGEMCTIVHSGARYGDSTTHERVDVVTLRGEHKASYTVADRYVQNAAFAPCDKDKYGAPFLMYRGNRVWKPNDLTGAMEPLSETALYAPLVMVNGKSTVNSAEGGASMADGVMYEGFNLLTRRYRAQFTTQGGSGYEVFKMPTALVNGTAVSIKCVTPNGTLTMDGKVGETVETGSHKVYTKADGTLEIYPCLPASLIADNLTVTATADRSVSDSTSEATMAVWFGGTQNKLGGTRLFLSGFTKDKAKVMYSDVGNPLYFPENNYMYVGDLSQRVTALEKQGSMLVVFKERELYYTTYVQGSVDAETVAQGLNVDVTVSQAYFPLTQLSPYCGCDAPHSIAVCRDRLVWICTDGRVYTLVDGSPYSERNVREIGQKIYPLLAAHDKTALAAASAMDHDGSYTVLVGDTAYSFDYADSGFVNLTSYYSSKSAAKNIAWYVHRYEGFTTTTALRLVSDGAQKALLITTRRVEAASHIRMAYVFTEYPADSRAEVRVTADDSEKGYHITTVVTDLPITASLVTKAYDFGDISAFKRVGALFLSAEGDDITVRFRADGEAQTAFRRVNADGHGGRLLIPGVKRCRTFQAEIETASPFTLCGLRLQYTPFGTVR